MPPITHTPEPAAPAGLSLKDQLLLVVVTFIALGSAAWSVLA